ncbi:hypothetical protein [Streptomyces sp. URMC 124]
MAPGPGSPPAPFDVGDHESHTDPHGTGVAALLIEAIAVVSV